ncbi:MAG: flagella basal body P-ring formation protein FlgA [Gemmatimonadales bacterium]|nr:flagella basal body P-ring formation protein FlgA [Gemmatimonadales bacterium]
MASSASVALAALLGAPSAPPPPPLDRRVAELAAERLAVPAARVRVQWRGVAPAVPAGAPARLAGCAPDGWCAVVVEEAPGAPSAHMLRIGAADSVPVAARPLPARATLAAADLVPGEVVHWGGAREGAAPAAEPGWQTMRAVAAGEPLTLGAARPPALIRAGDRVRARWAAGGVEVQLEGTALIAASLGEVVRLRVDGRPQPRAGRVTGPGTAELLP